MPNQHQLKNKFIYDLLHGLIDDEATVLRYSNLLGLDLSPPRAVILIDASDYILVFNRCQQGDRETVEARVRRRAQLVIGSVVSFFHLPKDTICAYRAYLGSFWVNYNEKYWNVVVSALSQI